MFKMRELVARTIHLYIDSIIALIAINIHANNAAYTSIPGLFIEILENKYIIFSETESTGKR